LREVISKEKRDINKALLGGWDDNYLVRLMKKIMMGVNAPQFLILEYPLIILFILLGGVSLMISGDVVSMFLGIELQSYGIYILVTLNRDSE